MCHTGMNNYKPVILFKPRPFWFKLIRDTKSWIHKICLHFILLLNTDRLSPLTSDCGVFLPKQTSSYSCRLWQNQWNYDVTGVGHVGGQSKCTRRFRTKPEMWNPNKLRLRAKSCHVYSTKQMMFSTVYWLLCIWDKYEKKGYIYSSNKTNLLVLWVSVTRIYITLHAYLIKTDM